MRKELKQTFEMNIQTSSGNIYSYLCRTNEIVSGEMEEYVEWNFFPLHAFSAMTELSMFIIGITEQCNLRCSYCCYSGLYKNNRTHSTKGMSNADIDEIYDFILNITDTRPLHIAFYGGEPLLKYPLIQYAIEKGISVLGNDTNFSITTNATMLASEKIDWLIEHNVRIDISIDGPKAFHDKNRVDSTGKGSYDKVYEVLTYIKNNYPHYKHLIGLQLTLTTYRYLDKIAREWNDDPILKEFEPANIHGLAPNFSQKVSRIDYDEVRDLYLRLLDKYEMHPEWVVLKVLFKENASYWKNRPIVDTNFNIPISTCMPLNTKLYIDAHKEIGICEKVADKYRIGNISEGLDWEKANIIVNDYYKKRIARCKRCPAIHMCNLCLIVIEYTEEEWDILCHNEQVYTKVFFWLFCEMAERGLIS